MLGLRSLYFLLAAVVDRFYLLKYGLARDPDLRRLKMLIEQLDPHRHRCSRSAIILGVLAISDRRVARLGQGPTSEEPR